MTPKEVLAQIRQREVTTVDLRFMDFPGVWQHFSIPADSLTEETFEEGIGFDGSSVVGLAHDQRVGPSGRPAARDGADRSVSSAADPDDDLQHPRSDHAPGLHARPPQHRPQGHELHAKHGRGRSVPAGSRARVFRFRQRAVRTARARGVLSGRFGGRGMEPGPGRKPRTSATSQGRGWAISPVHRPTAWSTSAPKWPSAWPNAASPRRPTFMKSPPPASARSTSCRGRLVESADQVVTAKYIIRNVARRSRKTATFMPKPLFGDNGSGMHTHLTLWKDNQPLLAGQGYAGLSRPGHPRHRRLDQARGGALRLRQSHHQ